MPRNSPPLRSHCLPPIKQIRRKLQFSELDCAELAEICISNREQYDPLLQAYHLCNDEQFRAQAAAADQAWCKGTQTPLTGVPVSLKNVFAAPGFECYAGTSMALPQKWQHPGTVVKRLLAQMCPISGLTHASELAFGGLGVNEHWGTPRNPWDKSKHRIPGGSSSGAALSVISGTAVFAMGTDTGGSVRVPAAAAGMVGFKTSQGLWPTDGIVPLSPKFDTVGFICRGVDDAIEIFRAIGNKGPEADSPQSPRELSDFTVRLADESSLHPLTDSLAGLFDQTLRELCKAGLRLGDSESTLFRQSVDLVEEGPNTAAIECSAFLSSQLPRWRQTLGPTTRSLIAEADKVAATKYLIRLDRFRQLQTRANHDMQNTDILISPTLSITTPSLEEISESERHKDASGRMLRNTVVANLCGFCAITLPCGLDCEAMPAGIQLMAKNGEDEKLLQFARLVEQVIGTSEERLGIAPLLKSAKDL